MIVQLLEFSGMAPRWHPRVLRESMAQEALLTRFDRRTLAPYRDVSATFAIAKTGTMQTIYRWGADAGYVDGFWFHWPVPVSVIRSPVPDPSERTFYFGDGRPKFTDETMFGVGGAETYPVGYKWLGLPRPAAPSVVKSGTPTETTLADRRFYQYTYVTSDGREGPPSEPSPAIDVYPGETVTVTMAGIPAGSYDISSAATKRLYRTSSGSTSTAFLLVDDTLSVGDVTYSDTVAASALGQPNGTATWEEPPEDLEGAALMPNGIMVGWRENEIWMCEPFVTHAWPAEYSLSTDSPIVGIGVIGMTAVICTKGNPYLITGVHPGGMTMEQLDVPQACVSRRSIAAVPGGIVYASPDGLVLVTGRNAEVVTGDMYRREEWQALNPESMHCAYHDGKLFVFHQGYAGAGGLLFDLLADTRCAVDVGAYFSAAHVDLRHDRLYLCGRRTLAGADFGRDYVVSWDADAAVPYAWRSKVFVLPSRKTFTCAKVIADAYPVTFTLYTDGVLRVTKSVSSRTAFRLPTGYEAEEIEVALSGTGRVNAVYVAESMDELRRT